LTIRNNCTIKSKLIHNETKIAEKNIKFDMKNDLNITPAARLDEITEVVLENWKG